MSVSAATVSPCKGYRFQPEIIRCAVWLYHRFSLSHRDVEELLAERGIQVSYEAIRLWCRKVGPLLAGELRRRHPRRGDKWYLDEAAVTMNKHRYWLWRAVDMDGAGYPGPKSARPARCGALPTSGPGVATDMLIVSVSVVIGADLIYQGFHLTAMLELSVPTMST